MNNYCEGPNKENVDPASADRIRQALIQQLLAGNTNNFDVFVTAITTSLYEPHNLSFLTAYGGFERRRRCAGLRYDLGSVAADMYNSGYRALYFDDDIHLLLDPGASGRVTYY